MKSDRKNKALSEKQGVKQTPGSNIKAANEIRSKRSEKLSAKDLFNLLLKKNVTALSRAITIIESTKAEHQYIASELINLCLPYSGQSTRIGITGVPGVGKSTFIEALGTNFIDQNKRIAILAVDPSSSSSKGSILGDKTRMQNLVKQEHVFIRPTPANTALGGVARKTHETVILCEAAGFDTIIIETVGVGQSEITVNSMVDFFLLLKLAGAGDELQGIKRGIIEMADLIVINKADGDNLKAARIAKQDFKNALHLYPPKSSGWQPNVLLCSAIEGTGIPEIVKEIDAFILHVKNNNSFDQNRIDQQEYWLRMMIEEKLRQDFYHKEMVKLELEKQLKLIRSKKTSAFEAAEYLLSL